jgi:hypothetical protein
MYKSYFKEKKIYNIEEIAKQVEIQVNKGNRTNALIIISKAIKDKYYENLFILISKINKIVGNTPTDIYNYELDLYKDLMKEIGRNYPNEYPILKQAFGLDRISYKRYDDDLPF